MQVQTSEPTFFVTAEDGRKHEVIPLYDYTIAGMVVSGGHSETLSDYYQDKLNVMDVGIIWGENLNPDIYRKVKFYTNGVRLYYNSKDRTSYKAINPEKVSNSHLLCIDPILKKRLQKLSRGDIVIIEGFLASYGGRKSSTKRTDTGDGACEVIWVNNLSLLQSGSLTIWNILFEITRSIIVIWIIAKILLFFLIPFKTQKD
jgi:hypothetical protein